MRFWDSSAIVPLLVPEPATAAMIALAREDPVAVVWWGTPVECVSAIARREREGALPAELASEAASRLRSLAVRWNEVLPAEPVRHTAIRLLRTHPLRSADALQLAAALEAADGRPDSLPFVCLDGRLGVAAGREGFLVVPG